MNYKIRVFNCGCRYIYITDPDKQIFKNSYLCPKHKKTKEHTIIYCAECGIKIIQPNAMSAAKQLWCSTCSYERDLERSRNYEYKEKNNESKTALETEVEKPLTQQELAGKAIDRWYDEIKFVLPVVETPILDKLIEKELRL